MSATPATDAPAQARLRVLSGAGAISAEAWNACAGVANPTLAHAFIQALEDSGSAVREQGWLPQHLALEDGSGRVLGLLPLYLKSHSMGEYVFDQGWAEAYERAGGRYYPKLQAGVPFTPVPGRRLLLRPDTPREAERLLIEGAQRAAEALAVSSLHIVFTTPEEWRRLGEAGFLLRRDVQFHWRNRGYGNFEDFLDSLSARHRKQIRKERRIAQGTPGLDIEVLTGDRIEERHWEGFFACYVETCERKWGLPYLTRAFFSMIGEAMPQNLVLALARRQGRIVAGALNLLGPHALYGRQWGALEEHPCLHFELCYYQAIEFAIAQGLERIEAGVQGPHKLRRGYEPVATFSAHFIRDPALREPIARYLAAERGHRAEELDALAGYLPFRKDGR